MPQSLAPALSLGGCSGLVKEAGAWSLPLLRRRVSLQRRPDVVEEVLMFSLLQGEYAAQLEDNERLLLASFEQEKLVPIRTTSPLRLSHNLTPTQTQTHAPTPFVRPLVFPSTHLSPQTSTSLPSPQPPLNHLDHTPCRRSPKRPTVR